MRDGRALAALDGLPRRRLAHLPTPLQEAANLRATLAPDGPRIWLKRDDETGFGLGGNKVRKLELVLAPERLRGVTHLVTTGGPQSNHARITAAAAASLGLKCVLVIDGEAGDPPRGNALLHRLFGADIRTVSSRSAREAAMAAVAREVEAGGGRALIVPLGASTPLGALGYARAARELEGQMPGEVAGKEDGPRIWIVVASSSGGTLGGLAAGFTLLGRSDVRLLGVSADVPRDELVDTATRIAMGALALVGSRSPLPPELVDATDAEVGEGYGIPTAASRRATSLLARREGLVLDPYYTAKAAAALIRRLETGSFRTTDQVVFWHTGGHPALLA